MSEDSGTNSESSDSESEVIWVSKPVTLPNNCNNVPNASSVDHNNHLNSSVEQMGSGGTLSFTFSENSRQRSGLENSSTVDPGYQIQDSGSFYNTISSENSSALRDNVSQNCESSQSTIHSDLPYIRRSTRVRNPPNRYGDWVVGEHEAQVWYV